MNKLFKFMPRKRGGYRSKDLFIDKRLHQTGCFDSIICPWCYAQFNGHRAVNYDSTGATITCINPDCRKEIFVTTSVQFLSERNRKYED